MRNTHSIGLGLILGAVAVTGCNSTQPDGSEVGTSQARIVAAAQGSSPATMHVTGTDDTTSDVVIDKTITVSGGSATVVDLNVPPSSYTFAVSVLGGASDETTLAKNSAMGDLKDGETTDIMLTAQGGGTSPAVHIGVAAVPQIGKVDVQLTGSGKDAMASIHVDATDPGGDSLTFFWSGAGLKGAVQGSSMMSISTAALTAVASPVVHVVVQGAQGAAASANITLALTATSAQATTSVISGDDAAAQACLETQAQCNATCLPSVGLGGTNVTVDTSCLSACSLSLATCTAD
jgi:hypothetical protein